MFKDAFIKKVVFRDRIKLLKERNNIYNKNLSNESIYVYQLNKFNLQWRTIVRDNKFYKYWYKKHNLPSQIANLEDLQGFPILTKKDIQEHRDLIFSNSPNCPVISTGGSTGEPTQFPTSRIELLNNYANTYSGRGWCNISPLDEIILFWGHSHLFGTGLKGKVNQVKRNLSDYLINTRRFNAYDMSVDTIDKYAKIINESNPKAIIGYTSLIYKLAKYFKENNLDIGEKSNLQAIIVTSETVTQLDVKLIEEVFMTPCVLEYGMAETGVIAYSKYNSTDLRFFWDSFIGLKDSDNILNITTIHDKVFPLINYRTDDIISTNDKHSILNISSIDGRKKDILKIISNDKLFEISGILLIHALKLYDGIFEIQFVQKEHGKVSIHFTANRKMNIQQVLKFFIENIKVDYPNIDPNCFDIVQVVSISKTIAGKQKLITKENI